MLAEIRMVDHLGGEPLYGIVEMYYLTGLADGLFGANPKPLRIPEGWTSDDDIQRRI